MTSVPSAYSVDSIQVKVPGDTEFRDIETSNFCYAPFDSDVGSTHLYNIALSNRVTSLTPDIPDGSEFKLKITNLDLTRTLGVVAAVAEETRAEFGDESGGSGDNVTILVKSIDPNINYSCVKGVHGLISNIIYIAAVSKVDNLNHATRRVIYSKSILNPVGLPDLRFDSEAVAFTLGYDFYGCRNEGKSYDSFIDAFFPNSTLALSGLTPSILEFLDDEMLPLLFVPTANSGMAVSNFQVRKSYGERKNLDGVATSDSFTGLIIRMELLNNGYSELSNHLKAHQIGTRAKSGGFKVKASAKLAVKSCTVKKKMKKGYKFTKAGKNIVCKKKGKKQK